MKKFIVLVAVLSLIAGTAYAAAVDDGLARSLWAQQKGRTVVSDGSVAFRIWYTGSGLAPAYGVSDDNTILLYTNKLAGTRAGAIALATTSSDTVQEAVDYINSLTDWHASVGPDAYPGLKTDTKILPIDLRDTYVSYTTVGRNESTGAQVVIDSSASVSLLCGVPVSDNKIPRIKQITHKVGGTGYVSVKVYDGDTVIWRKDISDTSYDTGTYNGASPDTITFSSTGEKGITGTIGKPLVVEVSRATTYGENDVASRLSAQNISIVYDQF